MGEIEMRKEVPMWAALKLPDHKDSDGTKEYRPKKSREHLVEPERVRLDVMAFMKRHGIALILIAAFAIYGWTVYALTKRKVTKDVTAAVETRMRAGFAQYLRDQDYQNSAANFLTGDASREAAIADLAGPLGEHAAGLGMDRHVTYEGIMTYLWVDCARLASQFRGKNDILGVLTDPQQIEHYTEGHATTSEYWEMGEEVARAYLTGNWPDGFTADLVYANINANGTVTARNDFQTGSTTVTWSYKRGK